MNAQSTNIIRIKGLKGKIIRHNRMLDVCAEVLNIFEGSTTFKLKINWYNQGFIKSSRIFYTPSYIEVDKTDFMTDWEWCIPVSDYYRNETWKKIK